MGDGAVSFAEHERLVVRQAHATALGLCNCCTTIAGRMPGRRICWWYVRVDHREGLCASCLRSWWQNAADDPDLAPVHLEMCA